jgi:hypothetical protein
VVEELTECDLKERLEGKVHWREYHWNLLVFLSSCFLPLFHLLSPQGSFNDAAGKVRIMTLTCAFMSRQSSQRTYPGRRFSIALPVSPHGAGHSPSFATTTPIIPQRDGITFILLPHAFLP